MSFPNLKDESWLLHESLQHLLRILSENGEEARVVGGAVRNALLREPVQDIDIATTTLPLETIARCERAGFKTIPTRLDHGVVTVIINGKSYQVTTLRDDLETDGRYARVRFGPDWKRDAERRDFTLNALYVDADGCISDFLGEGLNDLKKNLIRFIGDPEKRIEEDYLRILRFFRFFSLYGFGTPNLDALKACSKMKQGLSYLSSERIFMEIKKILSIRDPRPAILWMKKTGVFNQIFPKIGLGGNDRLHALLLAENLLSWPYDPFLRLVSLLPRDEAYVCSVSKTLKMSSVEHNRILRWARFSPLSSSLTEKEMAKILYYGNQTSILDYLKERLAYAVWQMEGYESEKLSKLLYFSRLWSRPIFPLKGRDVISSGLSPGPMLGLFLREREKRWVDSGFTLSCEALLL